MPHCLCRVGVAGPKFLRIDASAPLLKKTLLMYNLRDTAQFLRDRISVMTYKRQIVNVIKTRINETRKFIQIVIGSFD